MKAKIYLVLILLLTFSFCDRGCAQSPDWLWAKGMGSTNNLDEGIAITVDSLGNVYTIGSFYGIVDFDPGAGVFNLTATMGSSIFISKLDANGNFIWAKSFVGNGSGLGNAITLDEAGNIYATGLFRGTVDFDPGVGSFNLTSFGQEDIFILKLDVAGNFIFAKQMGGILSDVGRSIAVDNVGNIYTTGVFQYIADYNPDTGGVFNLFATADGNIFVSKLDSSGNFVWAKKTGGGMVYRGVTISIGQGGSGNLYLTGGYEGTADFNPDTGVFNMSSDSGSFDIFISKLDTSGNFIWAKSIGGSSEDNGLSAAIDISGGDDIFITGYFFGSADFDPGVDTIRLTAKGNFDIFVLKLDSSGNFIWLKQVGANGGSGVSRSIAIDALENVYTTGHFHGTVDFNPDSSVSNILNGGVHVSIFVLKLDAMGNFIWAKSVGGTEYDSGYSVAIGTSDNMFITGSFQSPNIAFGSTTLTNAGSIGNAIGDIFIAKLDTALTTGIKTLKADEHIANIYPNPATNNFTISLKDNNKKVNITITDITGKIIYATTSTNKQKIEVNTKAFAAGVYVVQIQTGDFVETRKLIVAQ